MSGKGFSLGIDLSTQSVSAVLLDVDSPEKVFELSLDYVEDPRLNRFGIQQSDYILPPSRDGEADQPPEMFFAALDALFGDMKAAGMPMEDIGVINASGQQHGHVYLNRDAGMLFARLREEPAAEHSLRQLLDGSLAYPRAPIWMTSDTGEQVEFVRSNAGGKERMIEVSGSDIPLRFTGPVMRRVAQEHPEAWRVTGNIQLLSSLVAAVLTGNAKVPLDYGNSCGTALMDYRKRSWSDLLIRATAEGLPGGEGALKSKLPELVSPDAVSGGIAAYFVKKYGFSVSCMVLAGSGDNPQSKVLVSGDLLSLGTSFVNMVSTDGETLDTNGYANAMYDGLGRPFLFGCRTNGAMVWDRIRANYGLKKTEYGPAEKALGGRPIGESLVFWQPRAESFPLSGSFNLVRKGGAAGALGDDYAGLVESTLASVYHHSSGFAGDNDGPLYVTGGATGSPEIMRRVAAIWAREVIPSERVGAAMGAAVAGAHALFRCCGDRLNVEAFCAALLKQGNRIRPKKSDIDAVHRPGGYLERFAAAESELIAAHPV